MMNVFHEFFTFSTKGEIEFIDLTSRVIDAVAKSGKKNGLVHVFAPHATGVFILNENDPSLLDDVKNFLEKIIPKRGGYRHPSNAHAHLRSILFGQSVTLPLIDGKLHLGTWQSLFFVETDIYPRKRTIIVQVIGE
jgi:secondary thiamine-phosphate synthase enzyme